MTAQSEAGDLERRYRDFLDEDERVAREAVADDCDQDGGFEDSFDYLTSGRIQLPRLGHAAARMVTTFAVPRRVLREVEVKRRRLERHHPTHDNVADRLDLGPVPDYCAVDFQTWPCEDIRDDMTVYGLEVK